MLILTRRVGESLRIGDEVSVTVLGIKGSQVRIGVNAPKSVSVHREEVYDRINDESSKNSDNAEENSDKNVNLQKTVEERWLSGRKRHPAKVLYR